MAYPVTTGFSSGNDGTAKPAGTVSGSFMFAMVLAASADNATITAPSGWDEINGYNFDYFGFPARTALYFKVAGASEPATYTWTVPNSFGVSVIISSSTGADGFSTASNQITSGVPMTFPSVTPGTPESTIVLMGFGPGLVETTSWANSVPAGTTAAPINEMGAGAAWFNHPTATATGTKIAANTGDSPASVEAPYFVWTISLEPAASADTTAPTITSSGFGSVNENTAFSRTLTANETVTWTKTGGADQALFTLSGNTLTMTAKDYENPVDANGDNLYLVIVRATDASGNWTEQTIQLAVNDVAEDTTAPTITSSATHSVAENSPYSTTATANETVTWSKSGTDSSLVTLNSSTGTWSIAAQDYETKPTVSFTLTATDAASNATNQSVTVTITDVTETEPPVVVTTARPFKLSGRFRGGDSAWWSPNTALILEKGFFQSADPVDPPVGVNFTRCYAFIF